MSDTEDYSSGSDVKSGDVGITNFHQRKSNDKHKKMQDYSLETHNDSTRLPKVDVCLRIKPLTIHDSPYDVSSSKRIIYIF